MTHDKHCEAGVPVSLMGGKVRICYCQLRERVTNAESALREIRIRLHAAGRRPEECYEMSLIDDVLASHSPEVQP